MVYARPLPGTKSNAPRCKLVVPATAGRWHAAGTGSQARTSSRAVSPFPGALVVPSAMRDFRATVGTRGQCNGRRVRRLGRLILPNPARQDNSGPPTDSKSEV